MKLKKITLMAASCLMLSACASNPTPEVAHSKLPDWVMMPVVENGFADTQCVTANADMNLLKNKASALARAEIAKQINLQVKAMDKTYQSLTEAAEGSSVGSTFESVSKQVTDQKLAGTRAVKIDYVEFPDNTQKLCVMVALNPALTKDLYKDLVAQSDRNLSPQNDAILFQEFKAYKAQQELDMETSK